MRIQLKGYVMVFYVLFCLQPIKQSSCQFTLFIKFQFYSQYIFSIEHFDYDLYYSYNNVMRYELIGIPLHFYSCVKRLQILMRQYIQYHVAQSY